MNYGPIVFLAAFFALSASWFGLVLTPMVQVGRGQQETNIVSTAEMYPQARPGQARQGEQIYRSEGCFYCHSQQIRQSGVVVDVVLANAGTNPVAVSQALLAFNPDAPKSAVALAMGTPKTVWPDADPIRAAALRKALDAAGAKAEVRLNPAGPDIARGWGLRRTVAADFLADSTAMPGSMRVGPDLANIGMRQPDPNWQLIHLYQPRAVVSGSSMPRYEFLFEKRPLKGRPSPGALMFPKDSPGPAGYEIVPTDEARELVAYITSLRADAPLYEAPLTVAVPAPAATNSPAKP